MRTTSEPSTGIPDPRKAECLQLFGFGTGFFHRTEKPFCLDCPKWQTCSTGVTVEQIVAYIARGIDLAQQQEGRP